MRTVDFLIVGGGLAAGYCASELRKQGADGTILLAGREPEPPYERPPLSKEYLRGEAERADAYVNPVVAVILGWLVLGETIDARTVVAGGVIVFAVALIVTARGRMQRPVPVVEPEPPAVPAVRAGKPATNP